MSSAFGPTLAVAGAGSLVVAAILFGRRGRRTILAHDEGDQALSMWERVSVHFVIYPVWSLVFGAVIWRGVPAGAVDVRFAFEKSWPVIEAAEWVYVSVYLVPLALPWLARRRGALRDFAINLWLLLGVSTVVFLALPLVAWPRAFEPTTLAGRLLAWETGRPDFAAASLPSFHVLWGLLGAQLLASRGRAWAIAGWAWAIAVAFACVATGAHAIADVAAAAGLFAIVASRRASVRCWIQTAAGFFVSRRPRMKPSTIPSTAPPKP